jgi:acetyl esterase/lipase
LQQKSSKLTKNFLSLTESEYGVINKEKKMSEIDKTIYVNDFTTISDILNNPLFDGFAQFIFPIKNIPKFDPNTHLYDIKKLLPYHNKKSINTNTTINVINYMLNEVNIGRKIFYDFYADHQKCDDTGKKSTGLFFFRGKKKAPFAVICAGGGFNYIGSIHGSFPIALELSKKGYNAFAIEYRTGEKQKAIEDIAAAISYIFENSETLEISTNNYSVWGGSSGAIMADAAGCGLVSSEGSVIPRPSMVVIAYTGHFGAKNYPPTFAFVSEDDSFHELMEENARKMRNAGIDVEFHKYKRAGHGFALGIGTEAEGWINNAVMFWEKHMKK